MKIMKNVTAMFLAVVMVFSSAAVFAEEITAENADESVTLFSESVVNRDDGVWLFPLSKEYYSKFTDFCGCYGSDNPCAFHAYVHSYMKSSANWSSCHNTGQEYSDGHNGFDVGVREVPVYAAAGGFYHSVSAAAGKARGAYVYIEHEISGTDYSYYSYYQHLGKFEDYPDGAWVNAGDKIGTSGNTGNNVYHLHFGIVIGRRGNPNGVIYESEGKGWLINPGVAIGEIVANPSASSPAGLPTGICSADTQALRDHCGSVRYTFDKNEVSIGESGNYKPLVPVTVPAGTYSIRTLCNTSKALDVNSGVADTYIWDENSNDSQKWKIEPAGSYYKIINVQTGLALDVKGGKTESGTQVQQYQYNGTAAQMWQFLDAGNGNVYIRSALGCYLDLYGANTNNGNNLYVYNLNEEGGRTNQTWQLKTISLAPVVTYSTMTTGDYSITCGSSYLTAASDVNNSAVTGTSSNGSTNQQFTIKPCGSSYYIESKSSSSGRVVNVNTSTHSANGNGVTVYYKTADGSQTWLFEKKGDKYIIHPTDNTSLALTLNSNGSVSVTNSTGASNQLWSVTNLVMCTVSFDANGGSGAPASITAPIDSTITISSQIPQRYGYDFLGWWIQGTEGLWYPGTSMQAFEVTFLAYWSPKSKNYVTYNANGGSGGPSIQSKYEGETLTLSTECPTRTGYTFQGWSTSSTGGVQYSPGSTYSDNADVTLYAVWERNRPGKPSISVTSTSLTEDQNLQVSWNNVANCNYYELHVLNLASNEHYAEWHVDDTSYSKNFPAGSYSVAVAAINSEVSGNATWTYSDWVGFTVSEKYYTISYNANGGENAPAAQTKRHNQSITITSEIPTRAGYKFKGWAGNPQGEVELVPGQVCDYNYSWTFYAVWESTLPEQPNVSVESLTVPENIPFTVSWNNVKNADYYEVWLLPESEDRKILEWNCTDTCYTTSLPAGNYSFQIAAINQERVDLGIDYANCGYASVTVKPIGEYEAVRRIEYNNHLYLAFDDTLTWEAARILCENMGGGI